MNRFGHFALLLSAACSLSLAASLAGEVKSPEAVALETLRQRAERRGYRLLEVRWDPVLRRRWAILQSLAHPERPPVAELTDLMTQAGVEAPHGGGVPSTVFASSPARQTELPVRSGERVTLWSSEDNVRMQMEAVAEGSGGVGDRIQLRVTGAGVNGESGWRVQGTIRGPGSVEMER